MVSAIRNFGTQLEWYPAVVEGNVSRKVDWRWSVLAWHSQSLDITPMDIGGHVKGSVYAVPPRTVDCLVVRFPAADTAVDSSIWRRLEECHAAHCLPSCNRLSVITRHPASFDGNLYHEVLKFAICCINFATIFLQEITLCRSCARITPHPVNITSDWLSYVIKLVWRS